MIDAGFSHISEYCPQTQAQEKYLYLLSHTSKVLPSALSVEVEDMIKIEYGLLESENILWKALMRDRHHHICTYGSSNDERSSSTNVPENISLSSMHIDQD
jgi:hypothetical protein